MAVVVADVSWRAMWMLCAQVLAGNTTKMARMSPAMGMRVMGWDWTLRLKFPSILKTDMIFTGGNRGNRDSMGCVENQV
jgi:hypothetical protein